MVISPVKAVLLDVDGTLYRSGPLRLRMALDIIREHMKCPRQLEPTFRIIRAFRNAQESLRNQPPGKICPIELQYRRAAAVCGQPLEGVRRVVSRWMFQRPLVYLRRYRRPGLPAFLEACRHRGLPLGALSDYPPRAKLAALGVDRWFALRICTGEAEIGAFKPAPDGILAACRHWCIDVTECLYIGDRPEVDRVAARRAGAPFVLIGRSSDGWTHAAVKDFNQLIQILGL